MLLCSSKGDRSDDFLEEQEGSGGGISGVTNGRGCSSVLV